VGKTMWEGQAPLILSDVGKPTWRENINETKNTACYLSDLQEKTFITFLINGTLMQLAVVKHCERYQYE
jgi:hypothetical protein